MTDTSKHASDTRRDPRDGSGTPDRFSAEPLPGRIGAMLRDSYQEVVDEGIPDDFLALLKKADGKEAGQ